MLDRRVDPGQKLELQLKETSLENALKAVADRCGIGMARLDSVVYLGPGNASGQLRAIAAAMERSVRRLPQKLQQKYLQPQSLVWDDLATPRDLLAQLGTQNGIVISGLEQIPHDLWATADLPPLSLVNRLSLIAVQFDRTFQAADDGKHLEIVPIPEDLPEVATERSAIVRRPAKSPSKSSDSAGSLDLLRIKRLSIQAEPLRPVLRQLANRLELELQMDEKAIESGQHLARPTHHGESRKRND